MKQSTKLFLAAGLALATSAAPAAAQRADGRRDAPYVGVWVGPRLQWWGSPGLDAFTERDFTPGVSLAAEATVLRTRRLSLGVGLGWDVATRGGESRGVDSRLTMHRVLVPVSARWHVTPWLVPYARLAPGVSASIASLSSLDSRVGDYSDTRLAFATDLSVGAAFGLSPARTRHGDRRVLRLWASPEVGWSLAGKTSFALTPPDTRPGDGDVKTPGITEPVGLPGFSPSGPFVRITFGLAF